MSTEQWCFVFKGHRYVFPTERTAKAVAFKMTGKIGALPVYRKVLDAPKERKRRDWFTFVRLLLVALGLAIVGLVWDAGWTVMTAVEWIIAGYEIVVKAWPMLALAFIAWIALVLYEWRYEAKLERELPISEGEVR